MLILNVFFSLAPPRFTKVPVDMIGVSGGVVSFVCQATGDPKPRVTWNKKGKRVNSQRIETIEFDEGAGAVLRIQPLRAPRDENIYECVAENSEGEISVQAKLSIIRGKTKVKWSSGPTSQNVEVVPKTGVEIDCPTGPFQQTLEETDQRSLDNLNVT
ncbi:hypothetical protein cypCar_00020224 [Cyprinus carpio]|nr:hypothetical protein cypCar_00020224 [Cyprinus carpio]